MLLGCCSSLLQLPLDVPTCPAHLHTRLCLAAQVWAVRENLCELTLGITATRLALPQFYGLTLFLVVVAYIISIAVPSE